MVRIDASYLITAPRELVWDVLTHPEREHEHTWLMSNPNEIIERRPDGVKFRTRRDRTKSELKRPDAVSVFDGTFDRANWRIRWRIVEGFEAGSDYVEELTEEAGGTRVRAHGNISLKGIEWDWRLVGTFFPWKARAMVERNVCRDYKLIKNMLAEKAGAR